MTGINQNYDNNKFQYVQQGQSQQRPNVQYKPTMQPTQLPRIYRDYDDGSNQGGFKEAVKKADMLNVVYPWLEHPFLMAGSSLGLLFGIDKFSKTFQGDYEKSLPRKAANFGDRIETSKLIQNKPVQTVLGWGQSISNGIGKLFKNSDLVNAIRHTPSQPEWSMVKNEMISTEERVAETFIQICEKLGLGENGFHETNMLGKEVETSGLKFSQLGLGKEEYEYLKKAYGKNSISDIPKQEAVNRIRLRRLGKSETEIEKLLKDKDIAKIVKEETLKIGGFTSKEFEEIKKDTEKYVKNGRVKEISQNLSGKAWVGAGNFEILGEHQPIERKLSFTECSNRLRSMSEAKTRTGRALSKLTQMIHRGLTFGGGKLGVIMFITPMLVETALNTKKAENNEKVGTAVKGAINSVSWVFTFPLALSIMHSLAGVQYAGMSIDEVKSLRNKIKNFNTAVDSGLYADKKIYDQKLKELKADLNALRNKKGQSLFTKLCKKIGSFVTLDLETIRSYRGNNIATNAVRKLPNFFKNLVGVPMRFGLFALIAMMGLDGAIEKVTSKIFGKSYDAFKAEEQEENKKEQENFSKADLRKKLVQTHKDKIAGKTQSIDMEINPELAQAMATRYAELNPINKKRNRLNQEKTINDANSSNKVQSEVKNNFAEENNTAGIKENNDEQKNNPQQPENNQQDFNKKQEPVKTLGNPLLNNATTKNPQNNNSVQQKNKSMKLDNYTYIPSSENVIKDAEYSYRNEPKYIPSQEAAKIVKIFDNSGLANALRRADLAEKRALDTLAGKFGYN